MRIDLEIIKKIEAYLTGTMDPASVKAFEQEISLNAELKNAVEQQRNLMKAMEKTFVKNAAIKAGQKVRMYSWLKKGGIVLTILVVLTAAFLGYTEIKKQSDKNNKSNQENILIPDMEKGKVYDPGAFIQSQYFEIEGNKDTVIVGANGTMFAIPAGTFRDGSNNAVNGNITVELKEALDPGTIMLSGLSTFSDDKPLETGGMFYINAKANGNDLKIGEGGILTSVPKNELKPGMMMFDGVVDEKGNINWVNPKQPEQFLLPVDIRALDFYPPGFVDAIKSDAPMGQHVGIDTLMPDSANTQTHDSSKDVSLVDKNAKLSKQFTDSLYLSFEEIRPLKTRVEQLITNIDSLVILPTDTNSWIDGFIPKSGISPSKVMAIWQSNFNRTFLATKEFESRMPLIHQTCNNAILNLYINNLDKKLYEVDSMAAQIAGGLAPEFLKFASMNHGRIENGDKKFTLLKNFYQRQSFIMAQAAIKTTRAFYAKNQQADLEAIRRGTNFANKEGQRSNQLFMEEYTLNLKKAYKDLGYQPVKIQPGFTAVITNPGWKNVDRLVAESLIARTTFDYTDTLTGRRSVIEYKEMVATVTNVNDFDLLNVYLIPNKLTTYMKVNGTNGKYSEKLNMTLQYDLFVIGYKNQQVYFQSQYDVSPDSYSFTLSENDMIKVADLLGKLGGKRNTESLKMAVNYSMFKIADDERRTKYERIVANRERLRPIVFPCVQTANDSTAVVSEQRYMPNLIGLTWEKANERMKALGLPLVGAAIPKDCDDNICVVVQQEPMPDTKMTTTTTAWVTLGLANSNN